jgi:hypothetical protein
MGKESKEIFISYCSKMVYKGKENLASRIKVDRTIVNI